jgi:hypothetical protein
MERGFMQPLRGLPRTFLLLWAVSGLGVSGFLPGCGSEGVQTSQSEPPETKPGGANSAKSTPPKQRLPKNVNPDASNRGIKGKYAD